MELLDKIELIREKTGVSYEDAKEALEASEGDVLDAIIWLERAGKASTHASHYETTSDGTSTTSVEMQRAQQEYREQSKRTGFGEAWDTCRSHIRRFLRAGIDMSFVAERKGERVLVLPVLIIVIGLFVWGASLWLLIAGLFLGFRYHIEGASPVTIDVNDAMNKAADAAESIRDDIAGRKG
jgi:hypothetical protein